MLTTCSACAPAKSGFSNSKQTNSKTATADHRAAFSFRYPLLNLRTISPPPFLSSAHYFGRSFLIQRIELFRVVEENFVRERPRNIFPRPQRRHQLALFRRVLVAVIRAD